MNGRNWHVVNAMQWEYIAQELNAINEVHTEDGVAKTARTGNDCSNRMLLRNSRYFDCCCRFRWRKYRHRNSAGSGTFYRVCVMPALCTCLLPQGAGWLDGCTPAPYVTHALLALPCRSRPNR